MLVGLIAAAALAYGAATGYMYVRQDALIFPYDKVEYADLAVLDRPEAQPLVWPAAAAEFKLRGVHMKAADPAAPVVLVFAGNQHDAVGFARFVYDDLVDQKAHVVGLNYRGYGAAGHRSDGVPSQGALYADALHVFDTIQAPVTAGGLGLGGGITLVGYSLGSAMATYTAANRDAAKIILLGPFDSTVAVAKDEYAWLPVEQLMKHKFPNITYMPQVQEPVTIIAGADDVRIEPDNTKRLAAAAPNLALYVELAGVNHGALITAESAKAALRDALN